MNGCTQDVRTAINWLDRADMVALLEGVGIAVYDTESTRTLKEAIFENVMDGTIEEADLSY
jgi:hypothetical protein